MIASLLRLFLLCLCATPCWAADPIRIGMSGPFTGAASAVGVSMRDGVRTAVAEINAAGGVLGRPIEVIERDDASRNDRGAAVAQQLIARDKVVATIGIANTSVALASQHYYQNARIPVVTAAATGSLITRQFLPPAYSDNYVFRVACPDALQALMIVDEAVERRRLKRLAILHDATNYGQLGRADLVTALDKRGLHPVSVERFNPGLADLSAQVLRARRAGAEAILTYGVGPDLTKIANAAAKLGWKVPLIGSWTLSMPEFLDGAGPNAEGARMPQTFVLESAHPRAQAFRDAWAQTVGVERMPSPAAAAQGYDAMLILAAAIRQAGSTEGPKLRDALEHLIEPVDGALMTYVRPFSPNDHEAIKSTRMVYLAEVRDGRIVFAYDEDRKRAGAR
ncbi:ABC transporter substrate-binding protein [Niveibacterium sp. 24ML]|uniref:ABC transporter substrate-binding protein n=1 Tax=Niveibacterium sp. 24ML TaxID=2985512 RepID=UPI002271553D|nr:ABC transporter substrate-binding protein [Niveibacterium sp. 24ML]MCX9155846.1 ABC transporter substrate-binding protein [Niveibacterium sp. 24ML]